MYKCVFVFVCVCVCVCVILYDLQMNASCMETKQASGPICLYDLYAGIYGSYLKTNISNNWKIFISSMQESPWVPVCRPFLVYIKLQNLQNFIRCMYA